MKKTILLMVVLLCSILVNAQEQVKPKIYVNPITYSDGSNISQSECLSASNNYLMGINKAKHVSITCGREKINTQTAAQKGYDYILNVNVNSITAKKDELFKKENSESYTGTCVVGHELISVKSGEALCKGQISGSASNAVESVARFESTTGLNNDALAMIDDALPIIATQINIEEADDDRVETAIINLGSEAGARKGMMFVIQQTKGSETTDLATARLEQILGKNSSRLNVFSKKGGEKKVLDAMNNADENTVITARSRALNSLAAWGKDALKNFGLKKEDKGDSYPSDINRTKKPKVAINNIYYASQLSNEASDALAAAIAESFTGCATIETGKTNAKTIENAAQEGWDALVDVTVTDASSKRGKDIQTKDGTKPTYIGSVTLSLYAINVATQAGINLRNISETSSGETEEQAIANAFKRIAKPAKKFFEDVFPVESRLETVTKFNKKGDEAKEASLSIGSSMGVKKNTKFDIFKQNLSVGEDSREEIGHGEVKKDPETGTSILVIQDGGKEIATILQSGDPDVGIIVVSRGHVNKLGALAKGLGLGGIF
ncbi:MAG: hypothetical protein II866_02645 [Prevotella sp.]|nr:hypothetical protein [Prevotella sp.]